MQMLHCDWPHHLNMDICRDKRHFIFSNAIFKDLTCLFIMIVIQTANLWPFFAAVMLVNKLNREQGTGTNDQKLWASISKNQSFDTHLGFSQSWKGRRRGWYSFEPQTVILHFPSLLISTTEQGGMRITKSCPVYVAWKHKNRTRIEYFLSEQMEHFYGN